MVLLKPWKKKISQENLLCIGPSIMTWRCNWHQWVTVDSTAWTFNSWEALICLENIIKPCYLYYQSSLKFKQESRGCLKNFVLTQCPRWHRPHLRIWYLCEFEVECKTVLGMVRWTGEDILWKKSRGKEYQFNCLFSLFYRIINTTSVKVSMPSAE